MGGYYYIIAGLPDISFDDSKPAYTVEQFREEVLGALNASDRKVMDILRLEDECRARGIHTLIGVIDSENLPSIELHRKCGYEYAGTVREAGRKFDRWLTIVYYQKIL